MEIENPKPPRRRKQVLTMDQFVQEHSYSTRTRRTTIGDKDLKTLEMSVATFMSGNGDELEGTIMNKELTGTGVKGDEPVFVNGIGIKTEPRDKDEDDNNNDDDSVEVLPSTLKFNCNMCFLCYPSESSLKRHMEEHDKNFPFICPFVNCSFRFKNERFQKEHLELVHPVDQASGMSSQQNN